MNNKGESIRSRAVVIATVAFQRPSILVWANQLNACVQQFTPETYRNPAQISGQQVLVIGDGATGRDIALKLADVHTVMLDLNANRLSTANSFAQAQLHTKHEG